MRQIELAQRDLDLHAGIGVMAEHFGNAPDRLGVRRRRLDEIDGDDFAGLRLAPFGGRHEDVVRDAPVLGHEDQHAALIVQAADDAALRALEHLDEHADRPAALIGAAHAH